jgi:hypothetical protein
MTWTPKRAQSVELADRPACPLGVCASVSSARNTAMSSRAIWDGPSSPIDTPACDPASRMSAADMAAIRMKPYAYAENAAFSRSLPHRDCSLTERTTGPGTLCL